MSAPLDAFVRHWSNNDQAFCGASSGSRTATAANVTCPCCRLEAAARLETRRRTRRLLHRVSGR